MPSINTPKVTVAKQVILIYDGNCPICQMTATAARIKQSVGSLKLIDARLEELNQDVIAINKLGFNLDEGMVLKVGSIYYHGADALNMMALLSSQQGWLNKLSYLLFRNKNLAYIAYPVLKACRNFLLWFKGIKGIHNLTPPTAPLFESLLTDWHKMPLVLKKRYSPRPFSQDLVKMRGQMSVKMKPVMIFFSPILSLLKILVPWQGDDIATEVTLQSNINSSELIQQRLLKPKGKANYAFKSKLIYNNSEFVEVLSLGICWRFSVKVTAKKVIYSHIGYGIRIFGIIIPIPVSYIFGTGMAEEKAISDNEFAMAMVIKHPLLGSIYEYKGSFAIVER